MKIGGVACILGLACGLALPASASRAQDLKPEDITVERVPANMKRVYVLDPVLPHVAGEFGVSIASAAGFSAVFAFTLT